MEKETVLFFDGSSARPSEVQALLFGDLVHLRKEGDPDFYESFPVDETSQNTIGSTFYLYLDRGGTRYLQLSTHQPLAVVLSKEAPDGNGKWSQRLLKQRPAVLLLVALALIVGLYFLLLGLVPYLGMKALSREQEIKIGQQLKGAMLEQEELLGSGIDSAATRHLQAFADRLRLSEAYPIRVTVLNSKIVNAYAIPGGEVVVYSGILDRIKTPEALAALLAHESTHINERHSLRSLLRSAANGLLASAVLGDASGISALVVTNAQSLSGLRYSRSLEREADEKGMELLMANGVNLQGMKQLMQTLEKEENLPGTLAFLSTHPLSKERLRATENFISKHPRKVNPRPDLQALFDKLKS